MKRLSKAQVRAHDKLLATKQPQSSYQLGESIATLNSLVAMKLVVKEAGLGSIFDPRTFIKYRAL